MIVTSDAFQIAYCREARRLRCRHAARPGRMLRAIGELSARYDGVARPAPPSAAQPVIAARARDASQSEFVRCVEDVLAEEILTYSRRLELLAEAHRLRIGRFQANLLIAEAQHRAELIAEAEPGDRRTWLWLFVVALGLELLAATAIYHALV